MTTEKRYPIPGEIVELLFEWEAVKNLRVIYAARPFGGGYKKAKRAAVSAEKLKSKICRMVTNIYPELKGESWGVNDLDYEPYLTVKK